MILKINWPQLPKQFSAFTTLRSGGVSCDPYDDGTGKGGLNLADHVGDSPEAVSANRALLAQWLPQSPQWLVQVHGTTVLNFDKKPADLTADACVTSQAKTVCAVLTADCLPVLFCDVKNGVIGAAHAGWRGLADGVLENTVIAMEQLGADAKHILAWLGPAIGPAKFEVGAEVRDRFIEQNISAISAFTPSHSDRFLADIYRLARLRLQHVGVHQISGGQFCTVSEADKFYSYRRDGVTGRMASVIWMENRFCSLSPIRAYALTSIIVIPAEAGIQ
jgi:polyphenol oxidase